jgi:[ribosomal protein S5]-alanine N-acetyltransferase
MASRDCAADGFRAQSEIEHTVRGMDSLLVGRRIRLRPFEASDVQGVFDYASSALVTRYLEWQPHRSLADSASFIAAAKRRAVQGCSSFAIEQRTSRVILGSCELRIIDPIHRIGEIGYALAPRYWGQGYNIEAGALVLDYGFAGLHLLRVQGLCDVDNRRSFRTLEKLGMVRERLLPRYRWRDGRYVDRYVYGILWREWARLAAAREEESAPLLASSGAGGSLDRG